DWLSPGEALASTTTPLGKVAQAICYDLRFSALFAQLAPAELFAIPAAFTARTGKAHWELLVRARAVENQAFVIAANQCGAHEQLPATYGHSMIVDAWGEVL